MIKRVADEKKQADKEALKAQKKAEKEALKAKKERIKQSKPKKSAQGNIFVRMGRAIAKFFKDFRGTCKKVIWPDRKTVLKNTLIVFITVVIVGAGIWIFDFALSRSIRGVQNVIEESASIRDEEDLSGNDEMLEPDYPEQGNENGANAGAAGTTAATQTTQATETTTVSPENTDAQE